MKLFVLGMSAVFCCAALQMDAAAQVFYATESTKDGVTGQSVITYDLGRNIQAILKRTRPGETLNYADRAELTKIAATLKLPAKADSCRVLKGVPLQVAATAAPVAPAAIAPSTGTQSRTYLPYRDDVYNSSNTSTYYSQTTDGYTPPSTHVPVTDYNYVPVNRGLGSEPLPATLITYYPANLCTELGLQNCPDSSEY